MRARIGPIDNGYPDTNDPLGISPPWQQPPPPIEVCGWAYGPPSSLDILGGSYTSTGYIVANPVYPSIATITGPSATFGIANNGGTWGVAAQVLNGPQTIEARWVWDILPILGTHTICKIGILSVGGTPGGCAVEASDDGINWTIIATAAQLSPSSSTSPALFSIPYGHMYRYWSFHNKDVLIQQGLYYYGGITMVAVLLWRYQP